MENKPLIVERTYNANTQRVWKAIADRDHMEEWYFDLEEFKPEVGFKFKFEGGPPEKSYLHLCKVTDVIEGRKIQYSWRYDQYPGNTLVTFELFPEGDNTRVRLSHEGLETLPHDNPDFAKENFQEGWNSFIGEELKKFVEA